MKVKEWPLEIVYKVQEWRADKKKDYCVRQKYGSLNSRIRGETSIEDGPPHIL